MYVEWAVEKCPAIAYRTLRVLRNLRSKSVNSFAGHPVHHQDKSTLHISVITIALTPQNAKQLFVQLSYNRRCFVAPEIPFVILNRICVPLFQKSVSFLQQYIFVPNQVSQQTKCRFLLINTRKESYFASKVLSVKVTQNLGAEV